MLLFDSAYWVCTFCGEVPIINNYHLHPYDVCISTSDHVSLLFTIMAIFEFKKQILKIFDPKRRDYRFWFLCLIHLRLSFRNIFNLLTLVALDINTKFNFFISKYCFPQMIASKCAKENRQTFAKKRKKLGKHIFKLL